MSEMRDGVAEERDGVAEEIDGEAEERDVAGTPTDDVEDIDNLPNGLEEVAAAAAAERRIDCAEC